MVKCIFGIVLLNWEGEKVEFVRILSVVYKFIFIVVFAVSVYRDG